jgi:ATP-dependent Clp protease ATP-binding subunit ClpB
MDIASYSSDARAVIKNARGVATAFRHAEIGIEDLLMAAVRHEGSQLQSILNQLGKSPSAVETVIGTYLKDQPSRQSAPENPPISPAVQEVLAQALEEKARLFDALVEPEHIFIAAFDPKTRLAGYIRDQLGFTKEDIYNAIADSKSVQEIASGGAKSGAGAEEGKKEVPGTLRYCEDLTNQAAAGQFDPVIGRDKEIQLVIQILLRRRKNSPVLVGGAGVGKSAIVEGFAQAVIANQVPKSLHGVKVMALDMGSLVAGAKYKGEFEERFKGLVGEVVKSGGRIILFIDELHTIAGSGSSGSGMDAANLIKPALARGQIRLIGATTEEEYTRYIEKDKALDRRFEKIKIAQPGFDDAVRIVRGVVPKYEEHHKIKYTEEAIVGSVKFAKRYLSERNLPDVALDVIDEAASEFAVKEEFAKEKLPLLDKRIPEIEKLFAACDGKTQESHPKEFDALAEACDQFTRDVGRMRDFWGHRLEAGAGGDK